MSKASKSAPEVIEDKDLDEASGGGTHLLEASAQGQHLYATTHSGGAHIALGDGSVRSVPPSVTTKG